MDLFEQFVTGWYLPRKARFSREMAINAPRATLPQVHERVDDGKVRLGMVKAINAECSKLRYTPDPLGGLTDFYNHPEFTQWRQNKQRWDEPCDCDDFAVYAVALFNECGVTADAWVWNLIISPGHQVTQAWANHVICGAYFKDSSGQEWTAVIDTNSAARGKPFWFKGNAESAKPAILNHFSRLYKVNYYKLIDVPFPF